LLHKVVMATQFKRILCPTDFSEFSRHALDCAVRTGATAQGARYRVARLRELAGG
jgi:hypothetical protein